jgi:hypothetical protein
MALFIGILDVERLLILQIRLSEVSETTEGYSSAPEATGLIQVLFSQPNSTCGPSMLIDVEDGRLKVSAPSVIWWSDASWR